jgi:hypothetical protein
LGGVLSLFTKEWSETIHPVRMWVPLLETCDLDFLPMVRFEDSEDMRSAVDCSMLEKFLLGLMVKATLLCLLGKKLLERCLSNRGTSGSARKTRAHLNLRTWRKLLVIIKLVVGRVVGNLLGRVGGFGLGQNPEGF